MKNRLIILLLNSLLLIASMALLMVLSGPVMYGLHQSPKMFNTSALDQVMMFINHKNQIYEEDGMQFVAKVEGRNFLVYTNGQWQKKFLRGVNIGAGKPGAFPGELAITQAEYVRWFTYISAMNADVIRVYTTLKPAFYDALYEYNKNAEKPLYLMQGVWVTEEEVARLNDAFAENEKIKNDLIKDGKDLVDILHGKASLPKRAGFANGSYRSDVSRYVIGWIIGIEWDPNFVNTTNEKNPTRSTFTGSYLHTDQANAFEAFLCEAGDTIVAYEASKYKMQRPVSYSNWPTADMLSHPNEPYKDEDSCQVNAEHIKPDKKFVPGVFASYHIYPYYPDFMTTQKEYKSFRDDKGQINNYKAYLRDLFKEHTIPVLVAEVGIPASRGMAHQNPFTGFDQGKHSETEQGQMVKSLLEDIYDEGYCGGLVFSWQDEWFKRTWNTMELDLPDTRPYWSNPQTNEQEFGLLAFDPGKKQSICYVDGNIDEWNADAPVYSSAQLKLFVKSDEKYVYLMAQTKDYHFDKDILIIPIDIIPGQGNIEAKSLNSKFSRPADILIQINGADNSRMLVDSYYDSFYWIYAEQQKVLEKTPENDVPGKGTFNPMYLCLTRGFLLPEEQIRVPFTKYETGLLRYGDANPTHENFNSLADFAYQAGNLEIRIPWQLLNVMDPSTKTIMGDFHKHQAVQGQKIDGFYFGAGIAGKELTQNPEIGMGYYTWQPWVTPTYHERLKPSYYILQDAFNALQ